MALKQVNKVEEEYNEVEPGGWGELDELNKHYTQFVMGSNEILIKFYKSLKAQDKTNVLVQSKEILAYLDNFSSDLKKKGLLKRILKTEWSEKEQVLRDRAIIQAAREYFIFLFSKLKNLDEDHKPLIDSLRTAIADLSFSLKRIDPEFTKNFILASTRTHLTSIEFKNLKTLFYSIRLPVNTNRYELDHLIIPYLRTILESKIKKILGIGILTNSKNQNIEISKIIEILFKIDSISLEKDSFNLDILKLIMEWLNQHMHRNIRPEPYIIHSVIQYLNPIFNPGKKELNGKILHSLNMSAYVENVDVYHKEIENKLNQKYPGYKIEWINKEIASPFY